MKIKLAYGEKGLWIDVPSRNLLKVLEIKHAPPLRNLREAFCSSRLRQLKRELNQLCISWAMMLKY